MEKEITIRSLALNNIRKKPWRTTALIVLIALSGAVLFASLLLTSSIRDGLAGLQNRIGADLMIVPEGFETQMESVLLSGEPNYFYLDKSIEDAVRAVPGVEKVTSQFYLTSLSESCCDFPIQIIGFDPSTDFIVKNWARKKLSEIDGAGEVILAGSNINTEKNKVTFFANAHKVTARLAKSGTGMDSVIYADIATLQKIFDDAKQKGFGFISDGDTKTKASVIFVKLADGVKPDSTTARIKGAVSGVQVIQSGRFVSGLMESISSFLVFLYAGSVLVILITVLTLAIVFSLSINERLREFSILRVLGADAKKLCSIVFTEAAILGAGGAVSGIFISALVFLPFNYAISQKINMPFVLSGVGQILLFALLTFAVLVAACLASAVYSALKVSNHEVYEGLR